MLFIITLLGYANKCIFYFRPLSKVTIIITKISITNNKYLLHITRAVVIGTFSCEIFLFIERNFLSKFDFDLLRSEWIRVEKRGKKEEVPFGGIGGGRVHNSRDGRRGRKGSALDLGQQDQEAGRGPTGRDVINDVGAGQLHHRDQDDPRTVAHQLPVSSSQVDQWSIL